MVPAPSNSKQLQNKGAWTAEEDNILIDYVKNHGQGKWSEISKKTGLRRCGRSCRLRWLNHLNPGIRKGNITEDEENLIIRLHKLLGNRWSLIAGRLPGRTDNEIKNYWNKTLRKKMESGNKNILNSTKIVVPPCSSGTDHEKKEEAAPNSWEFLRSGRDYGVGSVSSSSSNKTDNLFS